MEYRRANRGDIERFVENRVEFAASIRQIDELELFRKRTRDYVEEHMEKDDMVIFIAVEGDRIISSCMACIFHTAPLPSCPTGVCAELLNVYTAVSYTHLDVYKRQPYFVPALPRLRMTTHITIMSRRRLNSPIITMA